MQNKGFRVEYWSIMATAEKTEKKGPFSVVETGGKQYVAHVGDVLVIEKLEKEYAEGDKIVLDHVLMTDDGSKTVLGAPEVKGATVEGDVLGSGLGKKTTVIRYRSKSRHFRKYGHRQPYIALRVTKV